MTLDRDTVTEPVGDGLDEVEPLQIGTGRLVSMKFLRGALSRGRRVWLALAALGLVAGVGYHLAVPFEYSASASLYLAHPAATPNTVDVQNDLAMLDNATVARRAIALLGPAGKGLTPATLLGKAPGNMTAGNVLTVTVSGPTPAQAVHRVNVVAAAYLAFRAHIYEEQHRTVTAATRRQLAKLQSDISSLDTQIAGLGPHPTAQQLASLEAQRASATTRIIGLQQALQQDDVDTLSVVDGSRVITPGVLDPASKAKKLAVDGLGGLVAGLGLGVMVVIAYAVLSDKLRRREDLAMVVGAPVGISVGSRRRRAVLRRSPRLSGTAPRSSRIVGQYLKSQMATSPGATQLVVAVDDVASPAEALTSIATTLREPGKRVVLVDETRTSWIGRALRRNRPGLQQVTLDDGSPVTLLIPPKPWEAEPDLALRDVLEDVASPDVVLVLATVDPTIGAWRLRRWAADAIVTVTAGVSTLHRVAAVTELLDAAGITVSSAVMLGADRTDDSVGLPATQLGGPTSFALVRTTVTSAS